LLSVYGSLWSHCLPWTGRPSVVRGLRYRMRMLRSLIPLSPYDFCPRSTVGGLRHSFWIMRIPTRKMFPSTLMMATTMTMTTTSSQATGPFPSVTAVMPGFSESSATSRRCRSVIPFCLFRICLGRACRSLREIRRPSSHEYVQYSTIINYPGRDVYSNALFLESIEGWAEGVKPDNRRLQWYAFAHHDEQCSELMR
jgi:hypothetical protein